MEVVMTTGATNRAKLQSNYHHQQTNTQFFTGRMPFLSPNQQCQSTEGKNITFHGLAYPKLTWGLPTWPLIAPGYLWCQYPVSSNWLLRVLSLRAWRIHVATLFQLSGRRSFVQWCCILFRRSTAVMYVRVTAASCCWTHRITTALIGCPRFMTSQLAPAAAPTSAVIIA